MNKVIMIGRATEKPALRTTQSGKSVATFSIAVARRYDREQTDFFTIVAWGTLGDVCSKYIEKGQQIAVSGELQIRTWFDKNDQKRYSPEIIADEVKFLSKAGEGRKTATENDESFLEGLQEDDVMMDGLMDDELPF